MQNNSDELLELKSLLFEKDINTFERMEKKINELDFSMHNSEQIMARILPLFDDILLKQLKNKESKSIEIYAKYLTNIINKSAKHDFQQLSHSLEKIISPVISKEIEDSQSKMIDTLYPHMGSMISKYVTSAIQELMQNINSKIENGLSINKFKRKVKSKVSGISETEILLNESYHAEIRALFIIQKKSGLLIAEEHLDSQEIHDPHMVASMASAIKDFVNDWVSSNKKVSEIQLLSYGNATLYIESAGSVYLIAFLNSEPDHEERHEIQNFFVQIIKKYTPFFHTFSGDDSAIEIVNIKQNMQKFLHKEVISNTEEKKKNNFMKYLFLILLIPLLIYFGYLVKEKYNNYLLEKSIFIQTGEKININKIDNTLFLQGHVKNIESYNKVEHILTTDGHLNIVNEIYVPLKLIDKKLTQQTLELNKLKESISILQKSVDTLSSKNKKTVIK